MLRPTAAALSILLGTVGASFSSAQSVELRDLSVSDVQAPIEIFAGDDISVSARISSRSSASTSFRWSVFLTINGSMQGAIRLADFGPVVIAPNTAITVNEQIILPVSVTGRHRLAVVVDADNLIPERNEYDNTALSPDFTRIRSRLPDFSIANVQLDRFSAQSGEALQVTFAVLNSGNATAATETAVFLSRNFSVSTDDLELARFQTNLLSGERASRTLTVTIPDDLPAGDYQVAVIVDPDTLVTETREGNNIGRSLQPLNIFESTLVIQTSDLPSGTVFIDYFAQIQARGGNGEFQFEISEGRLPMGLQLDQSTGALTGKPLESGSHSFNVAVRSQQLTAVAPYTMQIAPSGIDLVITTPDLGIGTISLPFQIELTAAGGEPPYVWSLVDGALPQGIDLSTSGWLSGVPQIEGTYQVTLEVIDGLGAKDSAQYDFKIQSPNVTITTEKLPSVDQGASVEIIFQASGGRSPYIWEAKSQLPEGLSLSEDGVLTGVPAEVGVHPFRVKVIDSTDAEGQDTALFHLRVNEAGTFAIVNEPIESLLTRSQLRHVFRAEGGTGALSWRLEPGDRLPDGFEIAPNPDSPERELLLTGSSYRSFVHGFGLRVTDEAGRIRKTAVVLQVVAPEVDFVESCRCLQTPLEPMKGSSLLGIIFVGALLLGTRRRNR